MSFFGPTLTQLGADPNSPAITGSDGTTGASTSGSFLNEIGSLIGIGGTVAGNIYRTVNTPPPAQQLLPGSQYLLPGSSGVINTGGLNNSNLFLIVLGLVAVFVLAWFVKE
jgi:hypothetical protein